MRVGGVWIDTTAALRLGCGKGDLPGSASQLATVCSPRPLMPCPHEQPPALLPHRSPHPLLLLLLPHCAMQPPPSACC